MLQILTIGKKIKVHRLMFKCYRVLVIGRKPKLILYRVLLTGRKNHSSYVKVYMLQSYANRQKKNKVHILQSFATRRKNQSPYVIVLCQ